MGVAGATGFEGNMISSLILYLRFIDLAASSFSEITYVGRDHCKMGSFFVIVNTNVSSNDPIGIPLTQGI